MLPSPKKLESIFDFLDELPANGYTISTHTQTAVHDLLVGLAARGALPAHASGLDTFLAPVICSSPEEQERFYELFHQWLNAREETPQSTPQPFAKKSLTFAKKHSLLILVLVVVSAIALTWLFRKRVLPPPKQEAFSGHVLDNESSQPVANATVSSLNQKTTSDVEGRFSFKNQNRVQYAEVIVELSEYQVSKVTVDTHDNNITIRLVKSTPSPSPQPNPSSLPSEQIPAPQLPKYSRFDRLLALTLFGPLMIALVILLWSLAHRRLQLKKLRSSTLLPTQGVKLEALTKGLFEGPDFRRTLQELRRYRQFQSSDLNVPATVNATIINGGLFTPVKGTRKAQPEYLILIDRATSLDQQAQFEYEITRRLDKADIAVDLYYFRGDPRFCKGRQPDSPHVTIQDLAARHPTHYLIVFSDGSSFVNPLTGEPHRWLDLFSPWSQRTLLTSESPNNWTYREHALGYLGFAIFHATRDGIARFVHNMSAEPPREDLTKTLYSPRFPQILEDRALRWLEELPPDKITIDQLCFELRTFLGDAGYQWLSACAVYPELRWDMTLYFAEQLGITTATNFEERLLGVVRLPWFRYGLMPAWLRRKFISTLPNRTELLIRRSIYELPVVSLHTGSKDSTSLSFVNIPPNERSRNWNTALWRRLKAILFSRRKTPSQRNVRSDSRDYVFLSFMFGIKPNKLAVMVPKKLHPLLFRQGEIKYEMRPVSALVLTIGLTSLVSILGLWGLIHSNSKTEDINPNSSIYNPLITSAPLPTPETPSEITYKPSKGEPGKQYPFTVLVSDCTQFNFTNSSLISPPGSGVTLGSTKSTPCQLSSVLDIALNTNPKTVPLSVLTAGFPSLTLNFEILPLNQPSPQESLGSCAGITDIQSCPSEGCSQGGISLKAELNRVKNRVDLAMNPKDITLDQIRALPDPFGWTAGAQRDPLKELGEGLPVRVVAFMKAIRKESRESVNCGLTDPLYTDNHLILVADITDSEETSVTAEITPRIRLSSRPEFVFEKLKPLEYQLMRFTGWLMFDDEHFTGNALKRANNWEIHPVTQIEVCTGSVESCRAGVGWQSLNEYSISR